MALRTNGYPELIPVLLNPGGRRRIIETKDGVGHGIIQESGWPSPSAQQNPSLLLWTAANSTNPGNTRGLESLNPDVDVHHCCQLKPQIRDVSAEVFMEQTAGYARQPTTASPSVLEDSTCSRVARCYHAGRWVVRVCGWLMGRSAELPFDKLRAP
jgi:hypothetical protein